MPRSTMTSKGQTTVPQELREALDLEPGDKLTWEIDGGRVTVKTDRPGLYRWRGSVRGGPDDAARAVVEARKRRGRF